MSVKHFASIRRYIPIIVLKDKRKFKVYCEWHKQFLNKTRYHKVGNSFAHISSYNIIVLEEKQEVNKRVSTALINCSVRETLSLQQKPTFGL